VETKGLLAGISKGEFNPISIREPGLLMLGDLRNIRTIQVRGETHLFERKYNNDEGNFK